jgi:hypothetical protein
MTRMELAGLEPATSWVRSRRQWVEARTFGAFQFALGP